MELTEKFVDFPSGLFTCGDASAGSEAAVVSADDEIDDYRLDLQDQSKQTGEQDDRRNDACSSDAALAEREAACGLQAFVKAFSPAGDPSAMTKVSRLPSCPDSPAMLSVRCPSPLPLARHPSSPPSHVALRNAPSARSPVLLADLTRRHSVATTDFFSGHAALDLFPSFQPASIENIASFHVDFVDNASWQCVLDSPDHVPALQHTSPPSYHFNQAQISPKLKQTHVSPYLNNPIISNQLKSVLNLPKQANSSPRLMQTLDSSPLSSPYHLEQVNRPKSIKQHDAVAAISEKDAGRRFSLPVVKHDPPPLPPSLQQPIIQTAAALQSSTSLKRPAGSPMTPSLSVPPLPSLCCEKANTVSVLQSSLSEDCLKINFDAVPGPPFVCPFPQCGKTFSRSYNLKSHARTHTGERPYVCDFPHCNARFGRNHDLKRHQRVHNNNRPYQCNDCKKTFTRHDALSRHLKLDKDSRERLLSSILQQGGTHEDYAKRLMELGRGCGASRPKRKVN